MIKNLLRIIALLAVGHALYHFVPPYWHYQQFKDDVKQTALFSGRASESELVDQVMTHARTRQVPVQPRNVSVRKVNNQTFIDVAYQQPIEILPRYVYTWQVKVSASAFQVAGGGR